MDNLYVVFVVVNLWSDGFEIYRCDRNFFMGMSLVR